MQNDAACVASVEGQGQVAPSRPVLDPTFPARYFGARRRAASPQCAPAVGAAGEWVSDSISFVGVGGLIPPLHLIPLRVALRLLMRCQAILANSGCSISGF